MSAILRKYATGAGADVHIPIIKRAVVDFAVGADWTPATGDVKITIDGGATANIATLPVVLAMGNSALWKFVFSNAELTGKKIVVTVADSATKAVEDQCIMIETHGHASAQYVPDFTVALATPTNITAGVITTVTNLTNAPTTGDLTATMKTSVTTAATASTPVAASVTGAVGSVTGNVGGNVTGTVASVVGAVGSVVGHTPQTGDSFDRIGAAGAGLTAVVWNAAWDAEVQSEVADALGVFWTSPAALVDLVWDEPTSGHATAGTVGKALTDAGSAGDPWATALPGAYGAGTAGKIVGDNIDAPISAVDTVVDAILVDTNELQTDWVNGGRLDLLLDAIPTTAMRGTDNAATATALTTAQNDLDLLTGTDGATLATAQGNYAPAKVSDIPTAAQNFTAILTTQLTEAYAAGGTAPTLAQAILLIQQSLHEFAITSTTRTVKKLDGSTTAATFTLDSATVPTSTTRAT